jgi:hypothetical protein
MRGARKLDRDHNLVRLVPRADIGSASALPVLLIGEHPDFYEITISRHFCSPRFFMGFDPNLGVPTM